MSEPINIKINVPTRDLTLAKKGIEDLRKEGKATTTGLKEGFETVGDAIKENSKDVKAFGSTASQALTGLSKSTKVADAVNKGFNRTLKANPLFTLSGIIFTVISALADLVKNTEPVELVFKLIGDAIDFVIGLLKQFLDFLGLTSFAEKEAAAAAKKAAEDRKAVNDILYKSMLSDMEREIALLKAQGAEIETIEEKQLELARVKAATAAQELADNQTILEQQIRIAKARGEDVAELVAGLEEIKNAALDAQNALEILELNVAKARSDRREAEIKEAKRTQEELAAARRAAEEKRIADEKRFASERLRVERQIQDLSIANIQDATSRELEQVRVKYERLISDTLANENLLESEKVALIQSFGVERERIEAVINEKVLQKRLASENALKDFLIKQSEDEAQIRERAVEKAFNAEREKLKEFLAEGLITREEFIELEKELERKRGQDIAEIQSDIIEKRKELEREAQEFLFDLSATAEEKLLDSVQKTFEARNKALKDLFDQGLISEQEFSDGLVAIAQSRADELVKIERDRVERERQLNLDLADAKIQTAQSINSALSALAQASFEVSENLGEQDEKAQLKRAKKQFALSKSLNIVQAGINGAQAVLQAIAQFGPPPSPLGIAGIASAGVITAAQIAAIASQRFQGPTGADAVATPTLNLPSTNITPGAVTPQANFTATGLGQDIEAQVTRAQAPQTIRAVVSETDLELTNRRLRTIRQLGEL